MRTIGSIVWEAISWQPYVVEQSTQLLLEPVDWDVTNEATPDHVSKIPEMHLLNQAFARLGLLMPSKKTLARINTIWAHGYHHSRHLHALDYQP